MTGIPIGCRFLFNERTPKKTTLTAEDADTLAIAWSTPLGRTRTRSFFVLVPFID